MSGSPMVIHVVPGSRGEWTYTDETMTEDESRSYATAELALDAARALLLEQGGGELIEHGADGEIKEKRIIGVVDTADLEG